MRNYLFCALLAASFAIPTVASADHDDHYDHGHEHWDHEHWRDHEWHHHHHVYRDNYYMPYPTEPVYMAPRPVVVAPAPVVVAPPMYAVPPAASLNVVLPR